MKERHVCFKLVAVCWLWVFFTADRAEALPIFARKYKTACTTCHVVIPKLNPFGIAFRNNGYRIPGGDEKFMKDEPVSLGAPVWKQVWPKSVWPGSIHGLPPFALRVLTDLNIRPSAPVNLNFDMPHELEFYFAGTSGESFSFFGETEFIGRDNSLSIEKAYGQFRLLGNENGGDNWATFRVGRIDHRADPFSRSFRRLTSEHFLVSDYQAVPGGFRFRDRDAGAELWGAITGPDNRGGLEYGVGVIQGARIDNNNFKNYFGSVSYKFGGYGVAGSRQEEDSLAISDNYSEWSLLIGAFGAVGKDQPRITGVTEDKFNRVGFKLDAYLKNVNLYGAAVFGEDELRGVRRQIDTSAFFVEADYVPVPWIVPLIRFEKANFSDGRRNIRRVVPAVRLALRANIALLLEGRLYNKRFRAQPGRTGTNEMRIRFDFLF